MEKLTFDEIVAKFDKLGISKDEFIECNSYFDPAEFGNTECVYTDGEQIDSSHITAVINFKDHDVCIRLSGVYSSWDSPRWDGNGYEQVFPRKTIKTVYENPEQRGAKTDEV